MESSASFPTFQRSYGITIVVAIVLMLAFMSHHPTGHTDDAHAAIESISRAASVGRIVHGCLIAVMCLLCLGLSGVADALGRERWLVRGGWIAFVVATAAMVLAALINGFGVTGLVGHLAGQSATEDVHGGTHVVLALCHELNLSATWIGLISWGSTTGLWSLAMVSRRGAIRWTGCLGLCCALALCAGAVTGHVVATVHGLLAFIGLESIWLLAIAVILIRRAL